ncbi:MAG: hypothetical protein KAS12_01540 [Candidatus Aenigmarchaeota archaeon]|nr:hypothetical protein [Candidatus Aenigmarchaeota archaeon]
MEQFNEIDFVNYIKTELEKCNKGWIKRPKFNVSFVDIVSSSEFDRDIFSDEEIKDSRLISITTPAKKKMHILFPKVYHVVDERVRPPSYAEIYAKGRKSYRDEKNRILKMDLEGLIKDTDFRLTFQIPSN